MKIRTGFVSNSSSSSFLLIAKQSAYDDIVKDLTKFEIAVAEALSSKSKLFGEDVVVFSGWSDSGSSSWEYIFDEMDYALSEEDEEDENLLDKPYEAYDKIVKNLKETSEVFEHSEDW